MKLLLAVSCLIFLMIPGCVTEMKEESDDGEKYLMSQIDEIIERLPNQDGMALYKDIQHLVSFKQFAVEPMIKCLDSDNGKVRSSAALVLGHLKAGEAVDKLIFVAFNDQNKLARLEAARAVMEIGKWDTVPVLIEGLNDVTISTRQLCAWTLESRTGETFGYVFDAPEAERQSSILKWKNWWDMMMSDPTFADNLAAK